MVGETKRGVASTGTLNETTLTKIKSICTCVCVSVCECMCTYTFTSKASKHYHCASLPPTCVCLLISKPTTTVDMWSVTD